MYYVIDEEKGLVDLETALNTLVVSTESISAVGLIITIDGIECYGLNGTVTEVINIFGEKTYKGTGNSIFVDKNHDLSFYVNGSDWVNSSDWITSPGTFGYEWGGYQTTTGITNTAVGAGLSNTNSLIEMDLQPEQSGWHVVWDKIAEFRETHSDKWFLPSKDELDLIYEVRGNLNNLSTSIQYYYWCSSEYSSYDIWCQSFSDGYRDVFSKSDQSRRTRLCRQF